jgi:aminoglycoside phosphotransferase (APT) family kinase protein
MSVRLPSADPYAAQVDKEQRWLPVLAPRLPVPIPTPLARGEPDPLFPRPGPCTGGSRATSWTPS